ncbi:UNKNOWN [Stylonychia lemnae]|uniref:Uncharacterized protein n=1 Tax=Stylonychia lemnae TaxID=5949 RepID=A0A078AKK3_STYLE|nr:UNKNOWN [Stylonychia lemnae]|eukprot:CDW82885.1 UNKNOWN [Stylonychia lemnae]
MREESQNEFQRLFLYTKDFDKKLENFEYSDMIILPRSILKELSLQERKAFEILVQTKTLIMEIKPVNTYLNQQLPFKLLRPSIQKPKDQETQPNESLKINKDIQRRYLPKSYQQNKLTSQVLKRSKTKLIVKDQSTFEQESMLFSQSQLCWLGGFTDKIEDSIQLPKWLQNLAQISKINGVFVRKLNQTEVDGILFAKQIEIKPITPNCQILWNSIKSDKLNEMLKQSMDNYKLIWAGKILKLKINGNLYMYEVDKINPKVDKTGSIQIYYNDNSDVKLLEFSRRRYEELKSSEFDLYETYDFQFMEMRNMSSAMDIDEVLKKKGLDLEQIQIQEENNQLLLQIQSQLRELNIVDQHNCMRMQKSHSEKFFEGEQKQNSIKTKLMLKFTLQQQHNYEKKQFQKELDRKIRIQEQRQRCNEELLRQIQQKSQQEMLKEDYFDSLKDKKEMKEEIESPESKKEQENKAEQEFTDMKPSIQQTLRISRQSQSRPYISIKRENPFHRPINSFNKDLIIVRSPLLKQSTPLSRQSISLNHQKELNNDIQTEGLSNDSQILKPNYQSQNDQLNFWDQLSHEDYLEKKERYKESIYNQIQKNQKSVIENMNGVEYSPRAKTQETKSYASNNSPISPNLTHLKQPFIHISQKQLQERSQSQGGTERLVAAIVKEKNFIENKIIQLRQIETANQLKQCRQMIFQYKKEDSLKQKQENDLNSRIPDYKQMEMILMSSDPQSFDLYCTNEEGKTKRGSEHNELDDTNLENVIIHQLPIINKQKDYKMALEEGYYRPFRTTKQKFLDLNEILKPSESPKKKDNEKNQFNKTFTNMAKQKSVLRPLLQPEEMNEKAQNTILKIIGSQTQRSKANKDILIAQDTDKKIQKEEKPKEVEINYKFIPKFEKFPPLPIYKSPRRSNLPSRNSIRDWSREKK